MSSARLLLIVAIIGIVVGVAFGGGLAVGKGTAMRPAPTTASAAVTLGSAGGAAGCFGGADGSAGGGAGSSGSQTNVPTTGTVQSVAGNVITVAGAGGGASQFTTSSSTRVSKTVLGLGST